MINTSQNDGILAYKNSEIFQTRKKSFFKSLRTALETISNDELIKQMFEDSNSSLYIPSRVIEIIQQQLNDDREQLIADLLNESNSKSKQSSNRSNSSIKQSINQLSTQLQDLRNFINNDFQRDFFNKELRSLQLQAKAVVTGAISNKYISTTINQTLEKQINFMNKKFFEIDLPNMKSKYEEEIQQHIEHENQLEKTIQSLEKQNEKKQKEMMSMNETIHRNQDVIDSLKSKVKSLQEVQKQVNMAKNQIHVLEREVEKKNQTIDMFVNEKSNEDSVSFSYSQLQTSFSEMKKKYESVEKENSQLKEQLRKCSMTEQKNDHIQSINEADIQMLKTKTATIPQLQEELNKSIRHSQSLEVTNVEIANKLEAVIKKNKELNQTIEQLRDEISETTNDRTSKAELRSEIELLHEELAASKKQISDLDSNIYDLSELNQKIKREADTSKQTLEKQAFELTEQKSKLATMLTESETKISFLSMKLKEYENSIHYHMKQLRNSEVKIKELNNSNQELTILSNSLQKKLDEQEIVSQQTSISYEQSSEAYLYAQEELKRKEDVIERLLEADEISRKQKMKMNKKIEDDSFTIQKLNSSINDLSNENNSLHSENKSQSTKIDELTSKLSENEEKINEKENLLRKVNSSNGSLRKTVKSLESIKTNNEKVISELQEKIASDNRKIKKLEDLNQLLVNEKQNLVKDNKMLQKQLSENQTKFQTQIEQLEKDKKSLLKSKTETEMKLNLKTEEAKKLSKKLSKGIEEFDQLSQESMINQHESNQKRKKLNEKIEQYEKMNEINSKKLDSLLMQCNEIVQINKIHEIPAVLKKLKVNHDRLYNEDLKTRQLLNILSEFDSISEAVEILKNDLKAMQEFVFKIRKIIGHYEFDNLYHMIKESFQFKLNVIDIFEKKDDVVIQIQEEHRRLNEFEERETVLRSLFPNEESFIKKLPEIVTKMQQTYREDHSILQKLVKLFEVQKQDELPSQASLVLLQLNELKSIIPNETENTSKSISNLIDEFNQNKLELKQIQESLQSFNNDSNLFDEHYRTQIMQMPVPKQIENVLDENRKMKFILNNLNESLNEQSTENHLTPTSSKTKSSSGELNSSKKLNSPNKSNAINKAVYLTSPLSFQQVDSRISTKIDDLKLKVKKLEAELQEVESNLPETFETKKKNPQVLFGSLTEKVKSVTKNFNRYYDDITQCQRYIKESNKSINSTNLPNAVSFILTRLEECERQERIIKFALGDLLLPSENIQDTISEIIQQNNRLTSDMSKLNCIVSETGKTNDDVIQAVDEIVKERNQSFKLLEESNNTKIVFNSFSEKLENLVENDVFLTKLKDEFECSTNDEINNKIHEMQSFLNQIISMIPTELKVKVSDTPIVIEKMKHFQMIFDLQKQIKEKLNSEDVIQTIDNYIKQIKISQELQTKLNSILPTSIEGSIIQKVEQLIKQCLQYQRNYISLKTIIPEDYHGSVLNKVEQILNDLNKFKKEHLEIEQIVKNENVLNSVSNLCELNNEYKGVLDNICQIVHYDKLNDLDVFIEHLLSEKEIETQNSAAVLSNHIEEIESNIPAEFNQYQDVLNKIKAFVRSYQEQKEQIKELFQVQEVNIELKEKISNMTAVLNSFNEILATKNDVLIEEEEERNEVNNDDDNIE